LYPDDGSDSPTAIQVSGAEQAIGPKLSILAGSERFEIVHFLPDCCSVMSPLATQAPTAGHEILVGVPAPEGVGNVDAVQSGWVNVSAKPTWVPLESV
jgi:hypothetical protein